jgi:hypothetical protein
MIDASIASPAQAPAAPRLRAIEAVSREVADDDVGEG